MLIFYCTFHEILLLLIVKGGAINFDALHQLLYLLYFCRRLHQALDIVVKVQTCWTFKASADQCWHFSQSRKRPKVTEGRHIVLHRDIYANVYRRMRSAQADASVDVCAGCRRIRAHLIRLKCEVNRSREQRFLASTCGIWEPGLM